MMRKALPMFLAAAFAPQIAGATCYSIDFSTYGGRLNQGMTEAEAAKAMGYQPSTVTLETCGAQSAGGAWQCKIETWGSPCNGDLRLVFGQFDGVWRLNNWDSDPTIGF